MQSNMELANQGHAKGGHARASKLTPEERRAIARKAAVERWRKKRLEERALSPEELAALPVAKFKGSLHLMNLEIPCYVLSDGQRVIGRTSATEVLTGIKGGGAFEKYIGTTALQQFIDVPSILDRLVSFRLPEVEGLLTDVKGIPADAWIEVCQGMVAALEADSRNKESGIELTGRQREMAIRASMFLSAIAKVGLDALIDEATGAQYERAKDALEIKLRAYLETEMRKWEKTFPDELWKEFGRLTGWSHSVTARPKYWGHLVNELVYEYLDPDVAQWLKEHVPTPRHGQNYHQWLSSQYGLKKLIEHIWKLIGIAQTCQNMAELKDKMAELYGRIPFQLRMYLLPLKAGISA